MGFFKVFFCAAVVIFSAVAIFLGAIMMLTSLQHGAISISYSIEGRNMSETVTRAADSARFWRLFLMMGLLPVTLGATVMWYSVRKLRGR